MAIKGNNKHSELIIRFIFLPGLLSQTLPFLFSVLLLLVFPAAVPALSFFQLLQNINYIKQHKNILKLYLPVVPLRCKMSNNCLIKSKMYILLGIFCLETTPIFCVKVPGSVSSLLLRLVFCIWKINNAFMPTDYGDFKISKCATELKLYK